MSDIQVQLSEDGVAVCSKAGNITCYTHPRRKDRYVIRFIMNREQPVMAKEEARVMLQQIAYKLMSAASQL